MAFLSEAMRYDLLLVQTAAVAAIAQVGVWAQCVVFHTGRVVKLIVTLQVLVGSG